MVYNLNKKAATASSIVILVFATMILVSFALLSFYGVQGKASNKLSLADLNGVYSKEEIINFYIQNIVDKAALESVNDNGEIIKAEFINNFKIELGRYKINNKYAEDELFQIEQQINSQDIDNKIKLQIIEGKKEILISFDVLIKDKTKDDKQEIDISYYYSQEFKKLAGQKDL
jgi:hypothetical protein